MVRYRTFQLRWARLVTHRPFFTYKRSACGVYKNEWLEGEKIGSFRWATEMEPCVHNVISLCRHFLGVTFAKEDLEKPMWNRRCDTNHEALNHDVSGDAQLHLSAAMHQLSRPGIMELQARVHPPRMGGNFRYDTDITFDVNGLGAWTWRLRRKFVLVPPEVLQELGGDGNEEKWARIRTSWHSEINSVAKTRRCSQMRAHAAALANEGSKDAAVLANVSSWFG